jgi:TM2 domain-containing membrane protein YozV
MPGQQNDAVVYARMGVAAILGWLVPGLGHWILGCRARAVILFVTIGLTFWGGIALGGVKSTVDVQENQLWFIPQSFAGGHAIAAVAWSEALPSMGPNQKNPPMDVLRRYRYWPDVDLGQVYTGVAGLLNLLCVLDVLARAQHVPVSGAAHGRPMAREKPS